MAAAPQQGNPSDNSNAMLWWVAAIFAALGGIWYGLKDYIIGGYLYIKYYELGFLSYIGGYLSRFVNIDLYSFEHMRNVIMNLRAHPANIGYADLVAVGDIVGDWFKIPLAVLMFVLAVVVYFSNTTRVFRRNYSMQELAKLEKNNWPQISPIVGLDLLKTDIDKGPWAMAMTPMQFCKRNKLLEEVKAERREGMSRKDWDRINVVLKRGEANRLFALQLGPLWKNVESLPNHTKALFAVFAARLNADTKPATDILLRLNNSPPGNLDMTGVDALLKKHFNSKGVQQIVQNHAYVFTVMASMLVGAREDGVQASADFLWLKPLDRKLWYTLNTVGRQTPFIEVGGIFAHWVAEREAGRRLLVPMIEEATNALEVALKEVVYRPDE